MTKECTCPTSLWIGSEPNDSDCTLTEEEHQALAQSDGVREPQLQTLEQIVDELKKQMQCNCDLDNWQPEPPTGHSWVCRIHKAAMARWREKR